MSNAYYSADKNIFKTYVLMSFFFLFISFLGYLTSYLTGNYFIFYIFIFISFFLNFFSYFYSHKVVLKIAGAKEIQESDNRELFRLVENISITAGIQRPKIYIINDEGANAFATGRNYKNAVVAFTTGILKILNKNELEGVVAHEIAHIKNRDILLSSIISVLVGLISILADFLLYSHFGQNRNPWFLVLRIAVAILAPIIASLIHLAISRKREFVADATAVLLTRYPEGLASALEKISSQNIPLKRNSSAISHLYINNPNPKKRLSFWSKIFSTHPPVEERIEAILGYKNT